MAYENVTNTEMEILKILWRSDAPCSVADIRTVLAELRGWKATTVKTLLYSLRDKGMVEEVRRGVYRAATDEAGINMAASREFIRKQFGGSAKRLVASLLDSGELAEDEISELRAMLERGWGNDD